MPLRNRPSNHGDRGQRKRTLPLPLPIRSTCNVRRPLELFQRFPHISLHEELCSATLLVHDTRALFGPSLNELLQSAPPAVEAHPNLPAKETDPLYASFEWDAAAHLTGIHLSSVEMDFSTMTEVDVATAADRRGREIAARVASYLMDNGEDSVTIHHTKADVSLASPHTTDLKDLLSVASCDRKRPRDSVGADATFPDESHAVPAGLAAAEAAIAVDNSLRNHVSVSMPRRKNQHRPSDRLCVCPVFSQPLHGGTGESHVRADSTEPSMLYLSEVIDPGLTLDLNGIFEQSRDMIDMERTVAANVLQALDRSEAKVCEIRDRRQRCVVPDCDVKLLSSRRKLFGIDLPPELHAMSLSDEQIHSQVLEVLRLYLGQRAVCVQLKYLLLSYKRQSMRNPLDASVESGSTSAPSFATLGGKILPNMDAVREARLAQEEHLRFCGVVDQVEDYATIVVVAFLIDSRFASEVMDVDDERASHDAKKRILQTPGDQLRVPLGVAARVGSIEDESDSYPVSKPRMFTTTSASIASTRSPFRAEFCCSRDHYEAAMTMAHLQELYESVLIERLVGLTRCRMKRLPLAREYDEMLTRLHARCVATKDTTDSFVQSVCAIQRDPEFAILFTADPCLSIGSEIDDVDELSRQWAARPVAQTKKSLPVPFVPSQRSVHGCLYLLHRLWSSHRGGAAAPAPVVQSSDLLDNGRGRLSSYASSASPSPLRLRMLMIRCLVSPFEADDLIAQIARDVESDPHLRFDWSGRSMGDVQEDDGHDVDHPVERMDGDSCEDDNELGCNMDDGGPWELVRPNDAYKGHYSRR